MMVSKKMHQKKRFVSLPTQGKEGHLQYSYYCNTLSLTHTYTHTEREKEWPAFISGCPSYSRRCISDHLGCYPALEVVIAFQL